MPTPGSASRRWVSPRCSPSPWTPRCCSPRCARAWRRSLSNPVAPTSPTITYRDVTVDPGAASAVSLLVVDDDPVARAQLSALLRAAGYEVRLAEHGREAWDTLQVARIPVVICDWYMPEMDGPELCRRIRARRDQPYVYFILITSRGGREQYLAGCGREPTTSSPSRWTRTNWVPGSRWPSAFSGCGASCNSSRACCRSVRTASGFVTTRRIGARSKATSSSAPRRSSAMASVLSAM